MSNSVEMAHSEHRASAVAESSMAGGAVADRSQWRRWGQFMLLFALVTLALVFSFSRVQDDAFDTAYWMENGDVRSMLEYRHLIQRVLPFWVWQGLLDAGVRIDALTLLMAWDFASASLSLFLFYAFLRDITKWRPIAIAGAFAYGTANCIWLYAGSGRLYSTSMLLAIAAYYLAYRASREAGGKRLAMACASGALVCMGALFWMVQVFNAVGAGLLLLSGPKETPLVRRGAHFLAYSATGTLVAIAVAVSCLLYISIPLEQEAISAWMASAGTQPMRFELLGVMKAAFGQANGHLVMNELPYMINGMMLKDEHLAAVGNFPWQFAKFILIWALLLPVYLYPAYLLWRPGSVPRGVIFALYVPVVINLIFGIGWLGTDVQRFMPTLPAFIALGVISAHHWMLRIRRPRMFGALVWVCLLFIAGCNLVESNLVNQQRLAQWADQMKRVRPLTRPADLAVNFGRDLPVTYQTMLRFHAGAISLTLTNDVTYYDWDSPAWQQELAGLVRERASHGGRVFLMDRVVEGENPPAAAWSERQHPRPTVRQFAAHVRTAFCVLPGFAVGDHDYFELRERTAAGCPAQSLPPLEDLAR